MQMDATGVPDNAPTLSPPAPWPMSSHPAGHNDYQPIQTILEPEQQPPSSTSTAHSGAAPSVSSKPPTDVPTFATNALPWRPVYLRHSIIASFVVIFILVLVAIEVLLAYSNKNFGIAEGSDSGGQHYLWTYGPTALLTLVAAA